MGNQQIRVELESLQRAADAMSSGVVDDIVALSGDWTRFLQGLDINAALSLEESCSEYAATYIQAIQAYDQVLQGVRQDVLRFRDELEATCVAYRSRDDSVRDQMNRHLADQGSFFDGDTMGGIAYRQRDFLDNGNLTPDAPPATSGGR